MRTHMASHQNDPQHTPLPNTAAPIMALTDLRPSNPHDEVGENEKTGEYKTRQSEQRGGRRERSMDKISNRDRKGA